MTQHNRLACSTITFRMVDLDDALVRVAAADLPAIDLGAIARFCPHADPLASPNELGRIAARIDGSGLRVASVNAWSLTHLNDTDGGELPYLRAALRLAQAVHAPVLTVQPGRAVPAERWYEDARSVAAKLEALGTEAQELGVALAVEAPHKGTLTERFEHACEFVEMLDEDLVGVALDTSHVLNAGASIAAALDAYGERVRHVHLRDYRDGSILVTPGDGEIDFGSAISSLERLDYRGAYSFELESPDATAEAMELDLRRAIVHIDELQLEEETL